MWSLLISLYEIGQFLRIFLWITLPAAVVAMLVSTYFHYRRKREEQEGVVFAIEGYGLAGSGEREVGVHETGGREGELTDRGGAGNLALAEQGGKEGAVDVALAEQGGKEEKEGAVDEPGHMDDPNENADDPNEKIYKGILWMKEKYERYRDLADRRYEQVKDELARAEKRYEDLLAGRGVGKVYDRPAADAGPNLHTEGAAAGMGEGARVGESAEESLVWTGSDADREAIREIVKEKNRQIHLLLDELDQRIKNYHQMDYDGRENRLRIGELERQLAEAKQTLDERQLRIGELERQLLLERGRVEELVGKLQSNSLLLMNIYKELDRSLHIEKPEIPDREKPEIHAAIDPAESGGKVS